MRPLRIAIIGFGKIAGDQHVPAIEANRRLEYAGSVSRSGSGPPPRFTDYRDLLAGAEQLDAVAITTPPAVRYAIARDCIEAGLHVLLEKPPTVTLSEVEDLACLAEARQVSLFASWHAQHNPAVAAAARALAGKTVRSMDIVWHEDVHKWHPGQQWIWEQGGFGVFDPGINAFSIAVRIFPGSLFVRSAELDFPADSQTPIAAALELASPVGEGPLRCSLDWRRSEGEEWSIRIETREGSQVQLLEGGSRLLIDGKEQACEGDGEGEYPDLYREFVRLIDERRSSVDVRPLRLVADSMMVASRRESDAVGHCSD